MFQPHCFQQNVGYPVVYRQAYFKVRDVEPTRGLDNIKVSIILCKIAITKLDVWNKQFNMINW